MLNYEDALTVVDSIRMQYINDSLWKDFGWGRGRYRDQRMVYWNNFFADIYGCFSDVYSRQHDFDHTSRGLVFNYLKVNIPPHDALLMWVALVGPHITLMALDEDELYDDGLAEMIDSYLAGVPVEHIIG